MRWKKLCDEMIKSIVDNELIVQLRKGLNFFLGPLRRILLFNHTVTCILLIVLIVILSFLPLVIITSDAKMKAMSGNYYSFVVVVKYHEWLLITATCAGPMLLELLLDISKVFNNTLDIVYWISRALILSALIIPNLILYFLTLTINSSVRSLFPLIQTALLLTKQSIFVTGILMSMFNHKMEGVHNSTNRLSISVADWTVYALFCWILNRIFLVAAATVYNPVQAHILDVIRIFFAFLTLSIFLFIIIHVLSFLGKQQVRCGLFQSHEHMSDFYHTLVLLMFIVSEIVLNVTFTGQSEKDNPLAESRQENHEHFIASLYVQVAFTIALTVIPGRSYQLLADIKQQKLNTRLNLIRYVSHEMRTPLNTAFLGLEMLTSDLHSLHFKCDAAIANASSSTYNLSELNNASTKDFSSEPANKVEQSLSRSESAYISPSEQALLSISSSHPSGYVGHDSNNSITSEVEELEDTVRQVQDSCKVAVETLDDLLTFDKLDENKLVIEVSDLDPWCFLCEAAKPFEINARLQGVSFNVLCSAFLDSQGQEGNNWLQKYYINGDKFKLAQVIRNLCSNALKFTPAHGNVTIKLDLIDIKNSKLRGKSTDHVVRITVVDTGAGISPENQRKLFGQYVQFNASKLQQGKGSGLGLWISKCIVELHGGIIWAFSEGEGSGSTFGVDLPAFEHRKDISIDNECIHEGNWDHNVVSDGKNECQKQRDGDSPLFRMLRDEKLTEENNTKQYLAERKCDDERGDIENQLSLRDPKSNVSNTSIVYSEQSEAPSLQKPLVNPQNDENSLTSNHLSRACDETTIGMATHSHSGNQHDDDALSHHADISIPIPNIPFVSTPIRSKVPMISDLPNSNLSLFDHEVILKEVVSPCPRAVSNSETKTPSPAALNGHHSTSSSEHYSSSANNEATVSRRQVARGRTHGAPSSIPSSSAPKYTTMATASSIANPSPIPSTISYENTSQQHVGVSSSIPTLSTNTHPPPLIPPPPPPRPESPPVEVKHKKNWSTGLHFLIVDDTSTNRKMLKKVLMNAGHRVSEAVDGIDCLEQLDYFRTMETPSGSTISAGQGRKDPYGSHSTIAHDIDIVLMDECMPRMEGPECCQILFEKHFPVPIVAVTGTVSEEGAKRFLQAGAVAVLHKPLKVEMLKSIVHELFK